MAPPEARSCGLRNPPSGGPREGVSRRGLAILNRQAAANYAWVNRSSMTFLCRQAFARQFGATPDDLEMAVVYDVSHNIAKVRAPATERALPPRRTHAARARHARRRRSRRATKGTTEGDPTVAPSSRLLPNAAALPHLAPRRILPPCQMRQVEEHLVDGRPKTLLVHRKGSTRAFPPHHPLIPVDYQYCGQPVLVGGTMGTCSYVLTGTERGMEEARLHTSPPRAPS